MKRVNPGRLCAIRALIAAESGGHLEESLADGRLSDADRRLAWNLALGVCRRRGAIDSLIQAASGRPVGKVDVPVLACLRVAVYEQKLARTKDHAAVHQAVEATRILKVGRASGFVNAVLRKTARHELSDDPFADLPKWLSARWNDQADWLRRCREPARTALSWREGAALPEVAPVAPIAGRTPVASAWSTATGPVPGWAGFAEGGWWVMDPASAVVADIAAGRGPTVLDACASPGGKTLRMALTHGAEVTAVDLPGGRQARLRENLERCRCDVSVAEHDWADGPSEALGQFSVVLVDAPCTALGLIRRHPEVRWNRMSSDPASMAVRQLQILRATAGHVQPGGSLVYAVCSPLPEEGALVVAQLEGWTVTDQWSSWPVEGDHDAHQAFVLVRV